jgi:hypothetical protein
MQDIAWELYALSGLRTASRICDAIEALGHTSPPRSTVQSWIDRGGWRERLQRDMSTAFPSLMREIAGDLVLSGVYASRRLVNALESGHILDRDEREQIRLAIDHSGFSPVGDARGIGEVRNEGKGDTRRSIARYLSPDEYDALIKSGGASLSIPDILAATETESTPPTQ